MRKIGEYTVEETPIGIGGMGRVLKGTDGRGNRIAMKEILPEYATDLVVRDKIETEIKILWRLEHKSIVNIYSSFYDDAEQKFYIIMEFVDGMNLEEYIRKNGPLSENEAIIMMVEILEVMQYVHSRNIIHRDIKPANIMVREDKSICLLDFGIAKDTNAQSKTQYGTIIGTDGYMSPEQAEGYSIDSRSDIYALGCVLFYMLTGHHAFNTLSSEFETIEAIIKNDFPRLKKYNSKLSGRIQSILDKATDKDMLKRYQSCTEFAAGLRNGTNVNYSAQEDIKVSIGSDMCDIIIYDPGHRISRHHADVTLKEFTSGKYYVFTDTSSNGTLVNRQKVSRNSVTIRYDDPDPIIFLAGINEGRLDWNLVKEKLEELSASKTPNERKDPPRLRSGSGTGSGPGGVTPDPGQSNKKWIIALFVVAIIIVMLLTVLITLLVQQSI